MDTTEKNNDTGSPPVGRIPGPTKICYDCVNIILLMTVTLTICGVITTLAVSV